MRAENNKDCIWSFCVLNLSRLHVSVPEIEILAAVSLKMTYVRTHFRICSVLGQARPK